MKFNNLLFCILVFLDSIVEVSKVTQMKVIFHFEDDHESPEITEKGSDYGHDLKIEEMNYVTPQLDQHKVLFMSPLMKGFLVKLDILQNNGTRF